MNKAERKISNKLHFSMNSSQCTTSIFKFRQHGKKLKETIVWDNYIGSHPWPGSFIKRLASSGNSTIDVFGIPFRDMGNRVPCPRIQGWESLSCSQTLTRSQDASMSYGKIPFSNDSPTYLTLHPQNSHWSEAVCTLPWLVAWLAAPRPRQQCHTFGSLRWHLIEKSI